MNYRMIGYLMGWILLLEAILMLFPTAISMAFGESVTAFLVTVGILLLVSLPAILFKPKRTRIFAKEGFICVSAAWILLSVFGALPFVISGAIPNFIDALFETVSGFTTTGATILSEIESLPRGILFWRSLTHWIGGMGVLVFVLAIIPMAGGQNMHLLRAEVPGPTKGKLVPKMRQTAMILYGIYVFFTVVEFFVLLCCKLPWYDAAVTALGTAGTGGFSVMNTSIGAYGNPAAEWVIAIFMVIFSINFNLYFFILIGQARSLLKNEELRTFLLICLASTVAITINIYHLYGNLGDTVRKAFFHVTSIMSTAGFATADYNLWPDFSKTLLVFLTVIGACAGSTAGGLKISRVMILVKSIFRELRHVLRPKSVNVVRQDGEAVPDETVRSAVSYLAIYTVIIAVTVLLLSFDGFGIETNFTATLTCINNCGPGLGMVGPMGNYSAFSMFSKVLLSLNMLLGRLEIMPLIILFSPFAWKKH